ncbi:DUF1631 domain-containing protein [Pseudomaricurvus alkylphenolicus]|nr:DUF1631 domain-containing protein [Pseudomaricurvus alkylphenolicus]
MRVVKDSNKASVISIAGETGGFNRARLARLPAQVHRLREKAEQLLQQRLKALFDGADDALFDLADKASSNHDQNLYFEAMREVRLRRRDIEAGYIARLDEAFSGLLRTGNGGGPSEAEAETPDIAVDLDNLSLVDNEQLECHVAVESMVSKALERVAEPAQHIALRLDSLVPIKVYQQNNPLGPDVLCNSFYSAIESLQVDIKVKLVLLKLFDKAVVAKLDKIYTVLNNLLIQQNVLPSLTVKGDARRRPKAKAQGSGEGAGSPVLSQLRGLLHGAAQESEAGRGAAVSSLPSGDLGQVLTQLQQSQVDALATGGQLGALLSVAQLVEMIQQQNRGRELAQVDRDVINLINMLFQFVLDDGNLAEPMKALIARLQIPLLKVAVADNDFFNRPGHPARRLLNEMATAGLGWQAAEDGSLDDPLYKKMSELVRCLLADFDNDVTLFEKLLQDFIAFLDKETRRATVLERRTVDAEDGKARSEQARALVSEQLDAIIDNRTLPHCVHKILNEPWHNLLFLTCLKQGQESEEWSAHCDTAQDLIWSVTAPLDREGKPRLMKLLPDLLMRLQKGFEGISHSPFETNKLLDDLKLEHLKRLRMEHPVQAQAAEPSQPSLPSAEVTPAVPEPTAQVSEVASEATPEPTSKVDALDPQLLVQVDGFVQGCWFEFQEPDSAPVRCRLAAVIKSVDKYIFVNRTGVKVAEKSREQLAMALQNESVRMLDDGKLFDRALESVIGDLRKSRSGVA